MPDTTLTINHADGGSETYTINRDKFEGIRNMTVDGSTVSVDHTPPEDIRNLLIDAQNITINRDKGEAIRTLFIDGVEVTIDRTGEIIVQRLLELFPNAAAAYSLRKVHEAYTGDAVDIRKVSDNVEASVSFDAYGEVSNSSAVTIISGSSTASTLGEFLTEESSMTKDAENNSTSGFSTNDFGSSSTISITSSNPTSGTKSYLMSNTGTASAVGYPRLNIPRSSGYVFALNKEYRVQFTAKLISGTTHISGIRFGQSGSGAMASPSSLNLTLGQVVEYDGIINATSIGGSSIFNIQFDGTDGDFEVLFDDIKITTNEYDCTVSKWYDQSGNGNHATQAFSGNQPKIASNGNIITEGSNIAIEFNGVDTYLETGAVGTSSDFPLATFAVFNRGRTSDPVARTPAASFDRGAFGQASGYTWHSTYFANGSPVTITTIPINQQIVASGLGGSTTNQNSLDGGIVLGGEVAGYTWLDGTLQEFVVYTSDQSANRPAIESNIADKYGITLP